jgi:hypothetical protein
MEAGPNHFPLNQVQKVQKLYSSKDEQKKEENKIRRHANLHQEV